MSHTQITFRVWLKFALSCRKIVISTRVSCRTRGLTASLFFCRTAHHLYTILPTGVTLASRKRRVPCGRMSEQSPLTGCEPNDLVEVSSTEVTTMLLSLRKASIGSTYNSGEDVATDACVVGSGKKTKLGNAGSTAVNTGERDKCSSNSGFITPTETIMSHVHHTFQPIWEELSRCTRTRESQVEIQMFCRSLFQRKRESSLSIGKSAISFNCEPIMPLEEKTALSKLSEAEYHTRLLFWRTKESFFCLKHDPS